MHLSCTNTNTISKQNEVKTLEAKKTRLVGEVGSLRTAHAELEELQKKVDLLNKEVEGAKAA